MASFIYSVKAISFTFLIFLAKFGPIFVKNSLNLLLINFVSVINFPLDLNSF